MDSLEQKRMVCKETNSKSYASFNFFSSSSSVLNTSPEGVGVELRLRFAEDSICFDFCLANIAMIPSLRLATGSINLADSVPTLPTSFGT